MFEKVLVANRGEIAVRIIRALDELGIASVAVYSEIDREAPHVRRAGEAYLLGPGPAAESYLRGDKILEVARQAGAQAVHPGYGFLAENAPFARGLRGGRDHLHRPAGERDRGDGVEDPARASSCRPRACRSSPARPSRWPRSTTRGKIAKDEIGYPVAVKAAGGGGGKGFRVALTEDELEAAFEGASREGEKFFSDPTVYLERYLTDPRHVEVQVLADAPRQRDPPRRARLLGPAPPPEAHRGVPRPRRRRSTHARPDRQDRHRRGAGGRLPRRGHDRGALPGRRVLLPGDEHPRPGRALRDRDDRRASTSSRRASAPPPASRSRSPRTTSCCAATRSSAASTPRTRRKNFAPAPGRIGAYREPAGPGVRVDSGVGPGRRGLADVRPDGQQADRLGRRPRAGDARGCCARSASTRSRA